MLWIAGGAALLALAAKSKKARAADGPVIEVDSPTIIDVTPYPTDGRRGSDVADPLNSRENRQLPDPTGPNSQTDEADAAAAAAKAAELLEAAHPPAPKPAKRTKRTKPHKAAPLPSKVTDDPKADAAPYELPPTPDRTLPDGYDPAKARKTAPALADHLKRKVYDYDRRLVRAWQTAAALEPDGIYGGATRGALIHYGVASPPKALFKPTQTIPYTPPE